MKELSKTINLMALEHSKQVKVFTVDNSRMASKMVKGNLDGMMVQATKETSEKTKDTEKVFTSLKKVALRDNGRMIKYRGQAIW